MKRIILSIFSVFITLGAAAETEQARPAVQQAETAAAAETPSVTAESAAGSCGTDSSARRGTDIRKSADRRRLCDARTVTHRRRQAETTQGTALPADAQTHRPRNQQTQIRLQRRSDDGADGVVRHPVKRRYGHHAHPRQHQRGRHGSYGEAFHRLFLPRQQLHRRAFRLPPHGRHARQHLFRRRRGQRPFGAGSPISTFRATTTRSASSTVRTPDSIPRGVSDSSPNSNWPSLRVPRISCTTPTARRAAAPIAPTVTIRR